MSEHSGRDPVSIRDDESLEVFQIDSLEDVEFIMELEDELQKDIPNPEAPFQTVSDLIAFVRALRA